VEGGPSDGVHLYGGLCTKGACMYQMKGLKTFQAFQEMRVSQKGLQRNIYGI
jgi:hypothetical protein